MRISDWSSDVCSSDLTVLASFQAVSERRVHQHGRRNRAAKQVGDQFPVMRSDGGRGEDVGQTVSSCRIDLVEEQRSFLEATPESKGTIACGRFERSEEHTTELKSILRISYDVFCLQKQ